MSPLLRTVLDFLLTPFIVVTAPLYYFIAKTGIGMALCRRFKFHPLLIHFYQPVPEYELLPPSYFQQKQDLPGVTIDMTVIQDYLQQLGRFSPECGWPEHKTDGHLYFWRNPSFSYSSACILHAMIRTNQSRRLIEIGSGFSSLIAMNALRLNDPSEQFQMHCVEPYPVKWLAEIKHPYLYLHTKPVQELPVDFFTQLEPNDILFIDSSHVSKLNSDVNFLFLRVLPRLKKGVIVHIHDIYIPYEYPQIHFWGDWKIFWNEQYLLQAFLSGNKDFSIIFPGYLMQTDFATDFKKAFPRYDPVIHRATSSFWIKKIADKDSYA